MSLSDLLPYVPIIALILALIGIVLNYFYRRSDKIRRIVEDLIRNFINPSLIKLNSVQHLDELTFRDIYNGIPQFSTFSDKEGIRRLGYWHRILKYRINKYQELSKEIDSKIKTLLENARNNRILRYVIDNEGRHLDLSEEYEDFDDDAVDRLLVQYGLKEDKIKINELLTELLNKIPKLSSNMDRLRNKWRRKYYLINMDF